MAVDVQARGMAQNALEYAKNIEPSGVQISLEDENIITSKPDGLYAKPNLSNYVKQESFNTLSEKVSNMELFKFPNAIIHGEPIINNGQISGFSSNDYLAFPSVFDLNDRGFEFNFAITTDSNITTAQNIIGSKFCIALFIESGKIKLRISSNGTQWNLVDVVGDIDIQPNTTYYIQLYYDKLTYKLKYSLDGVQYTQIASKVASTPPFPKQIYLGIGNNFYNPFKGIINLNKCNLKVNNSIIWQGMDDAGLSTRLATDLENIDTVGVENIKGIIKDEYIDRIDDTLSDIYDKLNEFVNSLGGLKFGINDEGEYGYYKIGENIITPFNPTPQSEVRTELEWSKANELIAIPQEGQQIVKLNDKLAIGGWCQQGIIGIGGAEEYNYLLISKEEEGCYTNVMGMDFNFSYNDENWYGVIGQPPYPNVESPSSRAVVLSEIEEIKNDERVGTDPLQFFEIVLDYYYRKI